MAKRKKPPEENEPVTPAAEPQPPKSRSADRHRGRKMVPLPADVHAQLQRLADDMDRPLSRELRRIVTAALTEAGYWPPPPAAKT